MHLVMFDIDGTLIDSSEFEDENYLKAVRKAIELPIETDWLKYKHVSDSGILDQIIDVNGLENERESIHFEVKNYFIKLTKKSLFHHPVKQIHGAGNFLELLQNRADVKLAIATGSWEETAIMKLESAGIDSSKINLASSSDHFIRTEIMKIAENKCLNKFQTKTYFGDAVWDKQATQELGYNFVLVGEACAHPKQILNFENQPYILELIGLEV